MIKRVFFVFVLVFAVITAFCQDSIKIGFSVGDFTSDRWSQEPGFFKEAVNALGAVALIEYAYGDAALQQQQVLKLIGEGAKVILVCPTNADDWATVVDSAHKAGVKIIAYDRMLKNADVDYYLSFNNEGVGKEQAQYALDHRPKGNYVLLEGPVSDYNTVLLMNGQKEVLDPYIKSGAIKVIFEKHLDSWNSIDAYNAVQGILDKGDAKIDVILAGNDELAGGSIMALDMLQGTWDVLITGQDASIGGCQNILSGKQAMTVYKSIKQLATEAAATAVKVANNQPVEAATNTINNGLKDVPSVLLQTVAVDKDNMKDTVIKDGFIREDQLKQ